MANKKINELTACSNAEATDNTRLFPNADPTTGLAKYQTIAQAKSVFQTKVLKYVSDNTENVTLTIAALSGKTILLIVREFGTIYEVVSAPGSTEFTWNSASIVLGTAVSGANERFIILYI